VVHDVGRTLGFHVLYAPTPAGTAQAELLPTDWIDGTSTADYARLIHSGDRQRFYASYREDIRPTTDDRPFFFHTTKLKNQFQVAFGRSMLFGNGLSALLTLMGISAGLVVLFVLGPLIVAGGERPRGWFGWLVFCGAPPRRTAYRLGYPFDPRRADRHRGGDARANRHRAGNSDADRHPHAERSGAPDGGLGLGHERRPVGAGRHARDFHRHELGLSHDSSERLGDLLHRFDRSAGRDKSITLTPAF